MMVPRYTTKPGQLVILSGIFVLMITLCTFAQETNQPAPAQSASAVFVNEDEGSAAPAEPAPLVTLNVENGNMNQVLKAFSLQTGKSIVIGPEVVSSNVNVHLSEVAWDDALEVILKPYGYGYTTTGKAIVINRLDKIAAVKAVEPLASKVFTLNYLDASDIKETIEKHLSSRGSMSVLLRKGLVGWKAPTTRSRSSSRSGATALGKRERIDAPSDELQKSKTFIVTDIPSVLESVGAILSEVDIQPIQVLIEAKFLEVSVNYLKDIGFDFNMELDDFTVDSIFSSVQPNAFSPAAGDLVGDPLNALGEFSFTSMDDPTAAIYLRLLQEDDDSNLLSSPKVLTLNNQEATIIVGTKFPIIESDTSGDSAVTSTSLEYYENIGIQLNVVPQVCAGNQINMIVHPSVSEKEDETSGVTQAAGSEETQLTKYPIISVREVETQIILNDGETVVIGGLMEQREGKSIFKVPFLGDIPYLGQLFRRTVNSTENVELLVFLKATIVDPSRYAEASMAEHHALDAKRLRNLKAAEEAEETVEIIETDDTYEMDADTEVYDAELTAEINDFPEATEIMAEEVFIEDSAETATLSEMEEPVEGAM